MHTHSYYSNGKLLLTSEYVILDGALGLALPSVYGQYLNVTETLSDNILWRSVDEKGIVWFEATFNLSMLYALTLHNGNIAGSSSMVYHVKTPTDKDVASTLLKILVAARMLNPRFLKEDRGYRVITTLTFPRNWGLGSSSTLLNNIAQWANVDP